MLHTGAPSFPMLISCGANSELSCRPELSDPDPMAQESPRKALPFAGVEGRPGKDAIQLLKSDTPTRLLPS